VTFISQTGTATSDDSILISDVDCEPSVLVGNWVRMNSLGVAVNALANNKANSNVIGLVEAKSGNTKCTIRVIGLSSVVFTGLDTSEEYYLSDVNPGQMTTTPPTAPGTFVVRLGQPFSSNRFLINRSIRFKRS
jgi:hypothetical protein